MVELKDKQFEKIDEAFNRVHEALAVKENLYCEDNEEISQAYIYAQQLHETMKKLGISEFSGKSLINASKELDIEYSFKKEYKIVNLSHKNIKFIGESKKDIKKRNRIVKKFKAPIEENFLCSIDKYIENDTSYTHVVVLEKYLYPEDIHLPLSMTGKPFFMDGFYGMNKHKALLQFLNDLPVLLKAIEKHAIK